ncbi:MAG TPA: site-specific integrase [Corynebacterium amycolatum]|nr:site-specific integrase [Corynebacterium amycolatum]
MSVQRRPKTGKPKSGRVRWIVRYYDPSGRERYKTFTSAKYKKPEKAAKAYDEEQSRLLRRREWVDDDNAPLLKDLWPLWESLATNDGTRAVRNLVGKNLGDLGSTKITELRPTQLRGWQATPQAGRPWVKGCTGLSLNTRVNWWTQLSGCLHMAVTDEMLLVNPCSKVPGPGAGAEPVDPRTLPTLDQIRAAVEHADDTGRDTIATMIILAVSTGMRPGEVGGLRWRNVDRQAGVIHVVEQTVQRPAEGSDGWGPVKTRSSRRKIPVPPETLNRLREHRLQHPAAADDAMFRTATGLLWSSDRINHAVKNLTDDGWGFHALRHVYATSQLARGRSIKAVQKALGHASAATTMDTYWHVLPDEEDLLRGSASSLVRALYGQESPELRTASGGAKPENPR